MTVVPSTVPSTLSGRVLSPIPLVSGMQLLHQVCCHPAPNSTQQVTFPKNKTLILSTQTHSETTVHLAMSLHLPKVSDSLKIWALWEAALGSRGRQCLEWPVTSRMPPTWLARLLPGLLLPAHLAPKCPSQILMTVSASRSSVLSVGPKGMSLSPPDVHEQLRPSPLTHPTVFTTSQTVSMS